jgi:hypothetical protein
VCVVASVSEGGSNGDGERERVGEGESGCEDVWERLSKMGGEEDDVMGVSEFDSDVLLFMLGCDCCCCDCCCDCDCDCDCSCDSAGNELRMLTAAVEGGSDERRGMHGIDGSDARLVAESGRDDRRAVRDGLAVGSGAGRTLSEM